MQECIGGMRPPQLLANDHTGSILVCRAILVENFMGLGLQLKPRESADELGSMGTKYDKVPYDQAPNRAKPPPAPLAPLTPISTH